MSKTIKPLDECASFEEFQKQFEGVEVESLDNFDDDCSDEDLEAIYNDPDMVFITPSEIGATIKEVEKLDLSEMSEEQKRRAKLERDNAANFACWDSLKVGLEQVEHRPDISLEALYPPVVDAYIDELARKLGRTKESFAACVPAILGVLGGNSQYYTDANGSYKGKPGAWIILAGSTSAGKSVVMKNLQCGLTASDLVARELYKQEMIRYEEARELRDEVMKDRRKLPRETRGPIPPQIEKPYKRAVILTNTTIEALQMTLAATDQLLLYKDEFASLIEDFEKYGKTSYKHEFMSLFSNEKMVVSRKTIEDAFCDMPNLSVLGGCTNATLGKLLKAENEEDGFLQRFLVYTMDEQLKPAEPGEFDMAKRAAYDKFCVDMYTTPGIIVQFDQELREHFHKLSIEVTQGDFFEDVDKEYLGKTLQHACKIALGIKLAWNTYYTNCPDQKPSGWQNETLTIIDFEKGWRLVQHMSILLNQRRKNIDIVPETVQGKQDFADKKDADNVIKSYQKLAAKDQKNNKEVKKTYAVREIQQKKWCGAKNAQRVIKILLDLEDRGIVEPIYRKDKLIAVNFLI
jgi:hypothetical protein